RITKGFAQLVGEHESRVDDLALFRVTNGIAVLIAPDRILDGAEHLDHRSHLVVVELRREPNAEDAVLPQLLTQPRGNRSVVAVSRGIEPDHLHGPELTFDRQGGDALCLVHERVSTGWQPSLLHGARRARRCRAPCRPPRSAPPWPR